MSDESDFDFESELANMDDIQTGSKLLPEGDYNWVVTKATTGTSSNGNPGIKLFLEVIDGPYRGKTAIHDVWYSTAKQSGVEFFWRQMKSLGITSEWVRSSGVTKIADWADLVVGAQIVAAIKHEEYQEVERARTNIKKPIGVNRKIAGASARSSSPVATKTVRPPLEDDDDPQFPLAGAEADTAVATDAAAAEPVSVGAASTDTDDPWGTDS